MSRTITPMLSSEVFYATLCNHPFIIAGPCVLESFELALSVAKVIQKAAADTGLTAIFKASYDKANRTSSDAFRGPGLKKGLSWLARIREETGLPITTDVHTPEEAKIVGDIVDILQIPAFLCRQTSLLTASAGTGRIVNVKKGQFLAPWDMVHVYKKLIESGNNKVLFTERGTTFGYNNLVVDMRAIPIMSEATGVPIVIDATHSVQLPGGQGGSSGGDRKMAPIIAKAAIAAGASGVFLECHPDPDHALCDGPNSVKLSNVPKLMRQFYNLWRVVNEG